MWIRRGAIGRFSSWSGLDDQRPHQREGGRKPAASRARAVILLQSPAATASFGVSHEPPTQPTFGSARKSAADAAVTPPVGQNITSGNGPAKAFSMPMPPACCAGNSLSAVNPAARATRTSEGVMTPGSRGKRQARAASINAGVSPGLTPNRAPAAIDLSKSAGSEIVPTPTMASFTSLAMARIASSATRGRRVISSTRTPPATNALAKGTAFARSSMTITGMTGPTRISSRGVMIFEVLRVHGDGGLTIAYAACVSSHGESEDEAGIDELGLVLDHDRIEQFLVRRRLLRCHHRTDRKCAQCVGHRQRAFGRILAAGEGKNVRASLALAVEIHAAHLVHQWIH